MKTSNLSREQLDRLVRKLGKKGRRQPAPKAETPAGRYPLASAQRRLWFLDRLTPGSAVYNVPATLRLRGDLDPVALARSLRRIVRRHAPLRSRIAVEDGEPVQRTEPAAETALPLIDLAHLGADAARAEAERVATAVARWPFDLESGGLVRTVLVRASERDHLLAAVFHHIVFDGWSFDVFVRELGTLYRDLAEGRPPSLPEPEAAYADFVTWERERLEAADLEENLAHWRDRLAGAPPVLDLPADRPAPSDGTARGGSLPVVLDGELTEGLRAVCRARGTSLFSGALALFQALLGRHAATESPVVGVPTANRPRPEMERLIGLFLDTVPVRGDLSEDPSFEELVRRTAETLLEDREHAVPFERLVEEVRPDRDLARPPIFQVLFGLQNAPLSAVRLPGLEAEPVPVTTGTARLDLSLLLVERDGRLEGELEYSTDRFDRTTMLRFLEHFERLAATAVAAPERPVSTLPLLGAAERQQLREWNDTRRGFPELEGPDPDTVATLVADRAARTPDAVALVAGSAALTFGELERRAAVVARRLAGQGIGPEDRVAVCAERSLEMVVGLYGILRAGAAYVPLEPSHPPERLRRMVEDAAARAILVQSGLEASLPWVGGRAGGETDDDGTGGGEEILLSLGGPDAGSGDGPEPSALPGGAARLAYTLFTSGSTGRPKGAMNAHGGVVNRLLWMIEHFGFDADERFLQKTPFGFDVSVWELFAPLVCGGRLELVGRDGDRDAAHLAHAIAERRITTVHSIPSMLRELLEVPGVEERLWSLRRVVASGEALLPDLAEGFVERLAQGAGPVPELWNLYGPTEAAIDVTCWHYAPKEASRTVPIGRPVANTALHVVDCNLRPVPVGVAGELLIGGIQVGRGYSARPGLTAERFAPDPLAQDPGARVYRTGDLVRRRPDGALEFLGRIDHQVKLRGVRIELGEIERALADEPGVQQAVAMVLSPSGVEADRQLVACVVGTEEAPDTERLIASLADRLPDAMVPTAVVALDELPRVASGKVDRRTLAQTIAERGWRRRVEQVAPRTAAEGLVAEIWEELLTLGSGAADRVGVYDDFFALGGHSLLVTRMVARLRERAGVDLPVRTVFEARTLEKLAAAVEAAPRVEVPPIRPVPRDRELPLSFAQERLWFLDRMEPGRAWYNLPAAVRLTGSLNAPALARSLGEIVRRHEALRTVFREPEGDSPHQAVQVVLPARSAPEARLLPVVDLSGLPAARRQAEARTLSGREARRPFDLGVPPLLRSLLVRLSGTDHVLTVTMHHIVSDGWSVGIFLRELAGLYGAFVAGDTPALPGLPVQYPDFAAWQRLWLSGPILERRLSHWRECLAGAPELLELPTDRPRPPVQTQRGAQVGFRIPASEARALEALARDEGATLYMALLAVFDLLLHRSTGSSDLVVGSPVAGRVRPEVEHLIGFFVNTLPLRVRIPSGGSFRHLLAAVRETTLDAFDHEDVPFEKLVEGLRPQRDPSHTPVFQVVLALQNAPMGRHELPGVGFEPIPLDSRTAKFDLTLVFVQRADGGLTGALEYNRDLFDPTTARRTVGHFRNLLAGAAGAPDRPLVQVPLLAPAERHQIAAEWNDTGATTPGGEWRPVPLRLESWAERTPDAIALVEGGRSVTYGELGRRSRALARRLRGEGVGPEAVVALCLERSIELVVGAAAVLEAGAAYLPVDPMYPEERRRFMMDDAGAAVLVTPDGVERLAEPARPSEAPPRELPGTSREGTSRELPGTWSGTRSGSGGIDGERLAYVIYTSGSTGRPKGTLMAHRGLANLVDWHQKSYDLAPTSRSSMVAGPGFDASVWETWPILSAGGTLTIADRETVLSPERLTSWLAAERVDVSFLPTPLAEAVLEEPGPLADPTGTALRSMLTGGDALRRRPEPDRSFELINHYGPTESTVVSTRSRVSPDADPDGATAPPIGRPIDRLRVHVLGSGLAPVPIGVPGELHVGGVGLSRGYLGRAGLTAERFVPDPFGPRGARLYRTGDRVRLRPDGEIEFLGRIDHQVKIRGARIELGEIEARLAADPRVAAAVVLARADAPGGGRLDSYVVPADGAAARGEASAALAGSLRSDLADDLPAVMVPATFTVLAELPLTPNGKVDRRALADLADPVGGTGPAATAAYEPPRTPEERALAAIWSELLGCERVGRHEDFFALGGHSLLATRMVSAIRRELGVELPLRRLFEAPTVAGLARALDAERRDPAAGTTLPPIRRQERPETLPLSFAQERLWFLDRFEPGSPAYNIPTAVRLEGALDLATLTGALSEIVRRHEALRTRFGRNADGPCQAIAEPFRLAPAVVDLRRVSADPEPDPESGPGADPGVDPEVEEVIRREADRPFDLERDRLVRATLLRSGPRDHVFVLTLHHIVADGWSAARFVQELAALYDAFLRGEPSPLPELPVQYADYALWQREWLAGEELKRQLAYWRERLTGAPEVLELPTDRPRPSVVTPQGRRHPVAVDGRVTEGLRRLARAEGTTLFAVVLAAFDVLLYRITGQDDLLVGAPVANRSREEIEDLIGFFVNTLVLRVSVHGDPGFEDLLGRVRRTVSGAYAHQDLPFEKLVAELRPTRSRSHSPIFQVMLSLHDFGMVDTELADLKLSPVGVRGATAKYDLTLALSETPDGLRGILGYRAALFDATTIERMARHLDTLLRGVVERPERSVRHLPLLSAAEEHQIVTGFNDTPAAVAVPGPEPSGARPGEAASIHRAIEARAAAAPDSTALILGDRHLSYGALDLRAERLAERLCRAGAGPGERVAVCLDRSFDQIVAVVAALKAGAAYLPLDLGFPAERLAFMVSDARPVALVTTAEHRGLFDGLETDRPPQTILPDDVADDSGDGEPTGAASALAGGDDPAYVIYTSGSTGRPKGVLVSHRALVERLAAFRALFGFGPGDRQLQFASLSFDLSCDEVFLTLTSGATLVLTPRPAALRPLELLEECARRGVTKLSLTSSHWHQVVDELAAAGRRVPSTLRLLVTGAESPSAEKFAELARRAAPGTRMFNFYGPTEATISGTRLPLPSVPEEVARLDRVPIGTPFRGVRVYLADPARQPVPVGVAGEILLGGSGVAIGYLGRPALTAERFVPDPWSREPGARLYCTGDLARHLPTGEIEFLGRADTQVKVRGFRIELGEVEETLREHPDLREAAVLVRAETGAPRLVAYVVPEPAPAGGADRTPTVTDLRTFVAERLPEFMVPSTFVVLEAMPSTPTGKLDKQALPAPDSARPDLAGRFVAPETALERFLAEAWCEVLGIDRAGLRDSFFDLGGNSIQGATLINRLEETLGQHVYVTALFDTADLGELAHYIAVQYPERVGELFGEESLPEEARRERERRRQVVRAVDAERLEQLRALVEPLAPFPGESGDPNPPAVFVLSPPRSGSTLLRVMLAGHPGLFAPPELELLPFNTLGDRKREFSGRYSFWLEGVLRAAMELRGWDADEARREMEEREERDQPVKAFYRELQDWAGDRLLVDKTPSYALDPAILERAEEDFRDPLYIHLLRHPCGGVLSFEEARLEQLFFRYDHPFERRELAELIWTVSHQNILSFLDGVPEQRQRTVRFEDLVRAPDDSMRELSRFLGLEFEPAMVEPYQERKSRMTDGIHEQAKMLGDVKFHRHKRIDASAADRWREVYDGSFLGDVTRRMARTLGYRDLGPEAGGDGASTPAGAGRLPPCVAALRPGAEGPALFLVHAVFGDTYFFRHLAAELPPGRPVYGLRALGMEAGERPLGSIEEMAAHYVDAIRQVQPEGPYHLAGSSMGGLVAYEMARLLRRDGRRVGLLSLLDSGDPGEAPEPDAGLRFEIEALDYLVGETDPETVDRLRSMESRDDRLAYILELAKAAGALPASFDLTRLRRLMDVVDANGLAMFRYRPEPSDLELVHVRAAATAERLDRADRSGWRDVCPTEVEVVPGDHMSIHFPPQAAHLAGSLDRRMAAAEDALREPQVGSSDPSGRGEHG